jgi:CubicO group peptidase (beta-lactamase class C family)
MDTAGSQADSNVAVYNPEPERFSAVYKVLDQAIRDRAFPACAFGVVAEDALVLCDALGRFTYQEDAPAVRPGTVFDIASLTKVVSTTAVAMMLYQSGVLDLEMPLGELLPGFIVGRENSGRARQITLRHLLAHCSGLPGYVEFFRSISTAADLYRACLELPIEAVPGERAEYSDPGFILLGKALEMLLHADLAGSAQKMVFGALGLTSTHFSPPASERQLIPPTELDNAFRHRIIQGEVQDENAFILNGAAGHAGLFSNVPDLLRFAREILAGIGNSSRGSALFTADTIESFAMRQSPEGSSRGLGWDTPSGDSSAGRHFSPHSIGHLGFSGCSLWIDLDAAIAVVLLTNRTWPDRQNQLIKQVRPAFHNAVREAL